MTLTNTINYNLCLKKNRLIEQHHVRRRRRTRRRGILQGARKGENRRTTWEEKELEDEVKKFLESGAGGAGEAEGVVGAGGGGEAGGVEGTKSGGGGAGKEGFG